MKEDLKLKTDSNVSSMRWAFVWSIKICLFLVAITVTGSVVGAFIGKAVDLIGISALLSPIVLFSFSGKAGQAFAEKDTPQISNKE
jgi:hypothetical protein